MYPCESCGETFLTEESRNGDSARCNPSENRVRDALDGYQWRVNHD